MHSLRSLDQLLSAFIWIKWRRTLGRKRGTCSIISILFTGSGERIQNPSALPTCTTRRRAPHSGILGPPIALKEVGPLGMHHSSLLLIPCPIYQARRCSSLGWFASANQYISNTSSGSCRGLFKEGSLACGFLGCSSLCWKISTDGCDCDALKYTVRLWSFDQYSFWV